MLGEYGGRGQGKLLPDLKIFPLALYLEVLGNLLQNFIHDFFKPHPPEIKPKECCGFPRPATPHPSLW